MMSDESNWQAVETAWLSQDGESRLYRGDSLEVMSHMPDDSVDCVWTDPPYFLSNDGITCVAGRMVKVNKGEWDRSRGVENDHEFNRTWLSECYRILKPSGTIWVTGTLHVYLSVGMAMTQIGFRILNDIIWQKPNPPPNLGRRCFTHSTEMVLWATKARKGSKHRYTFHYDDMREENGGKQMKNVWQFSAAGRDEKTFGKHPTQKPVALIERCLRASTNPGDLVFDPFAGSGATGVAALGMGRRFVGCEREQEYVELITRRLSNIAVDTKPFFYSPNDAYRQRRLLERGANTPKGNTNGKGRSNTKTGKPQGSKLAPSGSGSFSFQKKP
jgi:site-specific DNA-methyltransferase (adenine-specific)